MAKKIKESGIVISKVYKPASESFEMKGKIVPAQPERWSVLVVCGEVDGENGMTDAVFVRFKVEEAQYEELNFMDKVEVAYEYGGDEKIKPLEIIRKI